MADTKFNLGDVEKQMEDMSEHIARKPDVVYLTRNNITQATGIDNWSISGFTQKTGYIRRVLAINPSKSDIVFMRTEDGNNDLITVYLKNISSSSITFNLEVIGVYLPSA